MAAPFTSVTVPRIVPRNVCVALIPPKACDGLEKFASAHISNMVEARRATREQLVAPLKTWESISRADRDISCPPCSLTEHGSIKADCGAILPQQCEARVHWIVTPPILFCSEVF